MPEKIRAILVIMATTEIMATMETMAIPVETQEVIPAAAPTVFMMTRAIIFP